MRHARPSRRAATSAGELYPLQCLRAVCSVYTGLYACKYVIECSAHLYSVKVFASELLLRLKFTNTIDKGLIKHIILVSYTLEQRTEAGNIYMCHISLIVFRVSVSAAEMDRNISGLYSLFYGTHFFVGILIKKLFHFLRSESIRCIYFLNS